MNDSRHTSLKDLAQALGVSIPTVSRALKDSPEISKELRQKVKCLAKEMNYRPNPFAMSLRRNTPRIIGVIVPDLVTHFFSSILSGIEDTAVANGGASTSYSLVKSLYSTWAASPRVIRSRAPLSG